VSQTLDEPFGVVELAEGGHGLTQVIDVLVGLGPEALLLQGADEPFGHAVALRLADEGGIVGDAEPAERALEVVGPVLAAPVVTELDASGHVRAQAAEAVDYGVVDGLEGGEAVAHLGHVAPGLVGVVVDEDEDPHPAVGAGPGHGAVRAPAQVGGVGHDAAVVGTGRPLAPRSLGGEQPMASHEAEDPVLAPVGGQALMSSRVHPDV